MAIDLTANTILARGASGNAAAKTAAEVRTILNVEDGSVAPQVMNETFTYRGAFGTSDDIGFFYTSRAITLVSISVVLLGSTPSYTFQITKATTRNGSGSVLVASNAYTAVSTPTVITDVSSPAIGALPLAAGNFLWIDSTATSGTVTELILTTSYTVDV